MAIKKFNTVAGLSVGENADIEVIDDVGNVAANNFTVSGLSDLGAVSSITITGGSSGSLLATDGSGNLFWTPPNPTEPAGISTSVQYNDAGALAGDSVFVYHSNTGTLYTTTFSGSGSELTNLSGANVTGTVSSAVTALVAGTVTAAAQGNITSLGTLTGLVVSGTGDIDTLTSNNVTITGPLSVTGNTVITGNLTVTGAAVYANVTSLNIKDPLILQGGNPNGEPLTSNDGFDRGAILNYYTTQPMAGFIGYDNSQGIFVVANEVTYSNNIVNINTYGDFKANSFIGSGQYLTDLNGSNVTGTVANATYAVTAGSATTSVETVTVTASAQPNITSVGTLTGLTVDSGLVGLTTTTPIGFTQIWNQGAEKFTLLEGDVTDTASDSTSLLIDMKVDGTSKFSVTKAGVVNATGLNAANIVSPGSDTQILFNHTGYVNAASGLTFNHNTNVLTVVGNIVSTNASLGNLVVANYFSGDGRLLTNIDGSQVTGTVANATNAVTAQTAGTVTTAAQPNITSVGTLTGFTSTGVIDLTSASNVSLGNVSEVHISGGVNGYVLSTDGLGNLSWVTQSGGGGGTPGGSDTQIQYNDAGDFGGTPDITYTAAANRLNATNVAVTTSITRNGRNVTTFTTANTTPSSPLAGDQWYDSDNDRVYQYMYDGVSYFWVDVSTGYIDANVAATAGTLVIRDGSGNIYGNVIVGTVGQFSNVSATGNITGSYFIGDGSQLTGLPDGYANANAAAYLASGNITTDIITTANVSGGNITTTGSVTGVGSNVTLIAGSYSSIFDNTGNITLANGIVTLSVLEATGNITGSYFIGNGSQLTGLPAGYANTDAAAYLASGNVTTDIVTTANISGANLNATYNVVGGNVISTNNMNVQGGTITVGTGVLVVDGGSAGIFNVGVSNVTLGQGSNVTMGSLTGNVTTRNNLIVGNVLYGTTANIPTITSSNITVADTLTAGAVRLNDLYSSRAPVTVTTNTVIDSFSVNKYRSAKYTIRVGCDDGYQAVEVLLVHDNVNSIVTIYGSISTTGSDIITLSTGIAGGTTVQLIASSGIANTAVNLLGTYVAD